MKYVAALCAALLSASIMPSVAQTIDGTYSVQGKNFDGSAYSGTADIASSRDTCIITWKTGDTSSQGICMRDENAFAASYILGKDVGLVVYQIMGDGSLTGVWTIAGQKGSGTEVLKPR